MSYARWSTLPIMALVAFTSSLAFAQANAKETPEARKEQGAAEAAVLSKLHHANQMEIKAGQLAKDNGASTGVKSYGERLIKDHRHADVAVRDYAERKGIELTSPSTPSEAERQEQKADAAAMARLAEVQGAEFDRSFASAMVRDHRNAIQMVRAARAESKGTEFRALLAKLLPVLEQHLKIAQNLEQQSRH